MWREMILHVDGQRSHKSSGVVTLLPIYTVRGGKGEKRKKEGGNEVGDVSWEEGEGCEYAQRPHILFPLNWCCH